MFNIVFIGAPGVGKGTQSNFIQKDYSIEHISTGDMFREHISNSTELGKKAKSYMDKGELVPDSLVIDMLSLRLKECYSKNGFMLDGFPRTIEQAKALDSMLEKNNIKLDVIINIFASENVIVERLLKRGRDDDNEETIRNRIEVFKKQSEPVLDYYKGKVNILDIESIGTPEEIYSKIKVELDKLQK